ncbi:hypothetical protein K440DRAFT_683731 [Wilcoxina mikolae CBS 423.85]|nr:hypothetical protein K440DRAFT_683731 [Wilcoxina mikolae CBS 423.85]
MRLPSIPILCVALMAGIAFAEISFNSTDKEHNFNGIIPASSLTKDCVTAYAQKLQCSPLLFKLRDSTNGPTLFTEKNLKELCTSDCADSLNSWDKELNKACTDDDVKALKNVGESGEYLSLVLDNDHAIQKNLYWAFCLQEEDKDNFCILEKNLPVFPTNPKEVPDFCKSSCRTQQAYLVTSSAKDAGVELDIYDPKNCPNVDISSFKMNVVMLGAFGTTADKTKGSAGGSNSTILPGTGYNYTLYSDDLAATAKKAPKTTAEESTGSSAAAAQATASGIGGENASIGRAVVSLFTTFSLAALMVACM